MNGVIRRPARGSVPWGLVGFLGLAAAVELFLARHDLAITTTFLSDWALGREAAARREVRRAEVLCLGDSLIKCGIATRALEASLGRRCANNAMVADLPAMPYFVLRSALREGARPSALIVGFSPHLLPLSPLWSSQWAETGSLGEYLEVARDARDAGFFARAGLGHLLRSYRRRFQVREDVRRALRGEANPMADLVMAHWRNRNVNRGALLLEDRPPIDVLDAEQVREFSPESWSCHPLNAAYIRRLFELAASQNLPVYWLLPAASPAVRAWRDRTGMEARYIQFVRGLQARFPGVTVLDARDSGFDKAAFADAIHLNARAAVSMTQDVADVLRVRAFGGGGGGRWVAMPRPRERPIDVPLEDAGQSLRTVHQALGAVRR